VPKTLLQKPFFQSMLKATRLTGKGSLMDATRLIQRTLAGLTSTASGPTSSPETDRRAAGPASRTSDVTDVVAKPPRQGDALAATPFTASPDRPAANDPAPSRDVQPRVPEPISPNFVLSPAPVQSPAAEPAAWAPPAAAETPAAPVHRPGSFTESTIQFKGEQYAYRLYIPASPTPSGTESAHAATGLLPLVVLLHGCKQNALDFAKGTGMNLLADQQQVVVLYPEQLSKANSGGCWNWFEPTHQTRSGEPGMIAALARKIMAASHGDVQIDPDRVYIAGLSAGGAMSAVVAELYPDIFAAVGVHSGLPAGAAKSMIGAFGAMRRGGPVQTATAMPTIIFHGSSDTTVHPDNGEHVSNAAREALGNNGLELVKSEQTVRTQGQRPAQRVRYLDDSGKPYIEHWTVGDGGHAWSGGDAAGSYTDPQGPSASRAMLAFFLQHKKG
jgi:poly(hydroxyalkanoate) depolymerase family esterase